MGVHCKSISCFETFFRTKGLRAAKFAENAVYEKSICFSLDTSDTRRNKDVSDQHPEKGAHPVAACR